MIFTPHLEFMLLVYDAVMDISEKDQAAAALAKQAAEKTVEAGKTGVAAAEATKTS